MEKFLFYATCLLILFLPVQFALQPAEGIDFAASRLIIPALFLLWVAHGFFKRRIQLPPIMPLIFLFTFLFFAATSIFAAEQETWGLRKILFLLSFIPFYFIAYAVAGQSFVRWEKVVQAVVWSAMLAAVIGAIQFSLQFILGITSTMHIWGEIITPFLGASFAEAVQTYSSWLVHAGGRDFFRAIALFPDPHMFAFYLELALPFAVGLACTKKRWWLFTFFAIVIFLVAMSTFSRGGYVGIIAAAASFLFLVRKKLFHLPPRIMIGASIAIGISILVIMGPISGRLLSSFTLLDGSNAQRLTLWTQAIEIIQKQPFWGVGIGNYSLAVLPSAQYRDPIYAHNLYLDIAAESGIFALVGWGGFLLWTFFAFARRAHRQILFASGAASVAAYSVHAFFETPLYSVHILPLSLVIFALGASLAKSEQHAKKDEKAP